MNLTLIESHPQRVLEAFRRGEFDQIEIIGQADEKEFFELCLRERLLSALVAGHQHECPVLYELVEQFVAAVGQGVMKQLILDRGFIDGQAISRCKTELGLDVLIPIKKNMDIWHDAWALGQGQPWQLVPPPRPAPQPAPPQRPAPIQRREAKRQQTLAAQKAAQPAPPAAEVLLRSEVCPIKGFTSWSAATVPLHVLLLRETYADGHQDAWGLVTTADFHDPLQPKLAYGRRTQIEERHRQLKCFYDLTDFGSRRLAAITAQVVLVLLTYTLRQWQLWKVQQEQLANCGPELIRQRLAIHQQWVVIYYQQAYAQLPLVSFARELAELQDEARAKALAKLRQLEQSLLCPTELPRPPKRE